MDDVLTRLTVALTDRYSIERELGAGGMATVYLAEDLKHHRQVAVKVLRPELAATLGPERFVREIEIAAGLTHPHILPLHDSGEADGFLYYVMPYIEGESLRDRLDREGKLSVDDGVRLTDQVASALSYAHERGVVHRDIKPENILLAGDQAIVADFGIARAVQVAGGEKLTGTGLAIGTPAYMSPEQALGQADVDGRSDVYALGCVVYETVSGRTPFEGSTPQALLAKHAADTVPGLRGSDPAIPVFVERAVEKALAKTPDQRFQSPRAFADALTTGTVVARVGRQRWPRRTVAGALAVVLLAVAGWWLATRGSPAIERLAVSPFTNLMNDPEHEYLMQGMHEGVMRELAQAGVAVIARTSVMQYQNTETPIRDIARELGVDAVIEASVSRTGDSVLIGARLVDPRTEAYLWFQSYERDLRNVVELHREVTRAIVDQIQFSLTPQAAARLAGARPVNPAAYEAYLRGKVLWDRLTPENVEAAATYFERALEIDPDYALAHVGIARIWGGRPATGQVTTREALVPMKAAVLKAIELDSTLAEAHMALANMRVWFEWDWAGAEKAFQRSIELNPNYPESRVFYSLLLTSTNRPEEGMAQIERALELDPLNSFYQGIYGANLGYVDRYDDAIAQLRSSVSMVPQHRLFLGHLLYRQGRLEEAVADASQGFAAMGRAATAEALDRGYAEAGYQEGMRRAAETMAALSEQTYVEATGVAALYVCAGDVERTFAWLERGFQDRDLAMVYLRVDPIWDSVRDDPRFQDLLRRMNLPG